jgi:DNA-binding MarR family transcriptional regulator
LPERDHIDRFLERFGDRLPLQDLVVEGIVDRIGGLNRRLQREADETLDQFGLNHGEWKVLAALWRASEALSPGELSRIEDLSSGAMTNRLDRLEQAGYVSRVPDLVDRRSIKVELTPKGQRIWEEAVVAQSKKEALVTAALTDREKEQLTTLLRKMMVAYEKREGSK